MEPLMAKSVKLSIGRKVHKSLKVSSAPFGKRCSRKWTKKVVSQNIKETCLSSWNVAPRRQL